MAISHYKQSERQLFVARIVAREKLRQKEGSEEEVICVFDNMDLTEGRGGKG